MSYSIKPVWNGETWMFGAPHPVMWGASLGLKETRQQTHPSGKEVTSFITTDNTVVSISGDENFLAIETPQQPVTQVAVLNLGLDAFPHPDDGIWVPHPPIKTALCNSSDGTFYVHYPDGRTVVSRRTPGGIHRSIITSDGITTFPPIRLVNQVVEVSDRHCAAGFIPAAHHTPDGWQWWNPEAKTLHADLLAEAGINLP